MSDPLSVPRHVSLSAWVDEARADPVLYRSRQATQILLNAIGITPGLRGSLVLKGGTLMALAFGSVRQTGDVDFTAQPEPEPYATGLAAALNAALGTSARQLGYIDIVCRVQKFARLPNADGFEDKTAPALQVTIGYAPRNSAEEKRLIDGKAIQVIKVDISFKEPVRHSAELEFSDTDVSVLTYSLEEIVAEKLRALLQQPIRKRNRQQDIYDIHWLITRFEPDADSAAAILESFRAKADARDIEPTNASLDDPEIRQRSGAEWDTLKLEIGEEALPDFDEAYERVLAFYRKLPW